MTAIMPGGMRGLAGHGAAMLALAAVLLWLHAAMAQTPAAAGLDVVVLIDQSESMTGSKAEKASDPGKYRISVAQQVVQSLASNVQNSPRVNTVSIIEFGTEVKVPIPRITFAYDPAAPERSNLQATLAVERLQAKNLIYTDTPKAFEEARRSFAELGPPAPGRRRVMLLVTDGRPERRGAQLAQLRREVQAHADELHKLGVEIWVMGIDINGTYWDTAPSGGGSPDGAYWQAIAGAPERAVHIPYDWPDLSKSANRIVDGWLGAISVPADNGVYVATPYLRELMISAQYRDPILAPKLIGPDGTQISPLTVGALAGTPGSFNMFDVPSPIPGKYRLAVADPTVALVSVREFGPIVTLADPTGEVERDIPVHLVFSLALAGGKPLQPLPEWPISGRIRIAGASGRAADLPLKADAAGRWVADWTPAEPGQQDITVTARFQGPDGKSYDLLRGAPATLHLTVSAQPPLTLVLDEPRAAGTLAVMPWSHAAELRFRLVEGANKPVADMAALTADPNALFQRQVLDRSGVPSGKPEPVRFAGDRFVVSLPVKLNPWRGEGWWVPVPVAIRINQAQPMLAGRTVASVRVLPPDVTQHPGGDRMALGGFGLRYPWWLVIGLALLGALLLVGALLGAFLWEWPRWRVKSQDQRAGTMLQLTIYDRMGGRTTSKTLAVTGMYRGSFKNVISIDEQGRRKMIGWLRYRRIDPLNPARAEIEYGYAGEKGKYATRLRAGDEGEPLKGPVDQRWRVALRARNALRAAA